MKPIIFSMPGNELLSDAILKGLGAECGNFAQRQFPDGETYIRILSNVEEKEVIVVCTLHEPNPKLLPLLFICNLLKDLKAKSICLVIPYLAYMRQDKQFNPGEAITSDYFAKLISSFADRIITIDPHLHRRSSMNEIYSIPCNVLHSAKLISSWIKNNIQKPLLIGPDSESEQWVSEVAKDAGAPYIVLEKLRRGDNEVEVSIPQTEKYKDHTPVLVDDIISTAHTMIKTIEHLKNANMKPAVCIGVHAVFANLAYDNLIKAGAKEVISCNTIFHSTNKIDVSEIIIDCYNNQ
jgi:ribose-phosphate pyrophosphokinase